MTAIPNSLRLITPSRHTLTATLLVILAIFFSLDLARAGSAVWSDIPATSDWNTSANWLPQTVPDGKVDVATFDRSFVRDVFLSDPTSVAEIVFSAEADSYSINVAPSDSLTFTTVGITNSSEVGQTFVVEGQSSSARGVVNFDDNASAGNLITVINQSPLAAGGLGGETNFRDTSNAGNATLINEGSHSSGGLGGDTFFHDNATAGSAILSANGGSASGAPGGAIFFNASATAGQATFTVNGGSVAGAEGGVLSFLDKNAAENAAMTVNGGAVSGAFGGQIEFLGTSTAGNSTIVVNDAPGGGADCVFGDSSMGGTARAKVFGNGTLTLFTDNFRRPVTLGSIEGDGTIILGSALEVGSNNLSTTFSGVMNAFSPLTKVGSGVLRLTGANTYEGGTTIKEGGLAVGNSTGSATGSGAVSVEGGILAGFGIIQGQVTVGTGSGAGALLAPGKGGSRRTTLTIQSALTLKADSTYAARLNTKKTGSDQVVANGVTIENGAQFDFQSIGNGKLQAGKTAIVISNTSANPISGVFANLADGSTLTAGRNSFQVSYAGGDGNDLTLTVVP